VLSRLVLAVLATVAVLLTAVVPVLCVALTMVATNGRVNGIVLLAGLVIAALWTAVIALLLRAVELRVWKKDHHGVPAGIGAVLGFVLGFFLRGALFVTGPDSDYPAQAYALLYLVTFAASWIAEGIGRRPGLRRDHDPDVPHNDGMQLTSGAARRASRALH